MTTSLLTFESFLLLALTLIPIGILAIVVVCIICYSCAYARCMDDADTIVPPWNQFRIQMCHDRSSTIRYINTTDTDRFVACMFNRQRQPDIIL